MRVPLPLEAWGVINTAHDEEGGGLFPELANTYREPTVNTYNIRYFFVCHPTDSTRAQTTKMEIDYAATADQKP